MKLFTTTFGASVSTARSVVVVAADMLVKLTKSALEAKFHSTSSAVQQPDCGVQVLIEKRAWDETRRTMNVPLFQHQPGVPAADQVGQEYNANRHKAEACNKGNETVDIQEGPQASQ